jgi:undecaprenyl diphosphate synthase
MSYKNKIDLEKVPHHVAIIMDGNGRWAAQRGSDRIFGHQSGVKAVKASIKAAAEIKIDYLTLYAFSTENWNRPKIEVDALMTLLVNVIKTESDELNNNNIRLKIIGNKESLPAKVLKQVESIEEKLSKNTGLTLVMALSYSSRWEIINAVKTLCSDVKKGKINLDDISQEKFDSYLSTANIPDPELMIRTSGENRLSNFLLWQLAYAELYFTPTLWPDFDKEDFWEAIYNYQQRERRFGMTSDQIKKSKLK